MCHFILQSARKKMLASNDKASKYSLKRPLRFGSVSSQQLMKTNLIFIKISNLQRIRAQSPINQRGLWENDTTETLDHVTRVGLNFFSENIDKLT